MHSKCKFYLYFKRNSLSPSLCDSRFANDRICIGNKVLQIQSSERCAPHTLPPWTASKEPIDYGAAQNGSVWFHLMLRIHHDRAPLLAQSEGHSTVWHCIAYSRLAINLRSRGAHLFVWSRVMRNWLREIFFKRLLFYIYAYFVFEWRRRFRSGFGHR